MTASQSRDTFTVWSRQKAFHKLRSVHVCCMQLSLNSVCYISAQSIRRPYLYYLTKSCHLNLTKRANSFNRSLLQYRCTSNVSPNLINTTPAHMTRMIAQAIRSEVEGDNAKGAVSVVYSMLEFPVDPRIKPFKRRLKKAIDFGRPLPSRLVTHALVHAFLRKGLLLDAAIELRCMVSLGHKFHAKTLQATFRLLCSDSPRTETSFSNTENAPVSPDDTETARLLASQSHILSPRLREALNLLLIFRLSRHRRGKDMFDQLIDACLLQGQIVIATLLFVLMVKDWQLRSAMQGSRSEIKAAEANTLVKERLEAHLINVGSPSLKVAKHLVYSNPMPNSFSLAKILRIVNQHILLSSSREDEKLEFIESLLVLSELLRDGSLPGSQVSYLIRILQNCPSSPSLVTGVVRNGQYVQVDAYESIHSTLKDLCSHAPTVRCCATLRDPRVSSPMEFTAYTALLHYALRHRYSLHLANDVLTHMTKKRQPAFKPDTSVYNILLRSSSLLRRNDLAKQILDQLWHSHSENNLLVLNGGEGGSFPDSRSRRDIWQISSYFDRISRALKGIRSERLDTSILAQSGDIIHDMYTLTSYIVHLVSIGHPEAVIDIVFELFPELNFQRIQEETANGRRLSRKEMAENYQRCIIRGMRYGPHIFCALLNALAKAGETSLAERVYRLAKDAELASWKPNERLEQLTPWRLPIHAYTSMLQCYANESKKALQCIRGSNRGSSERPIQQVTPSVFVRGWGGDTRRKYVRGDEYYPEQPLPRNMVARKASLELFESLQRDTYTVWQDVMHARTLDLYPPQWATQLRQQMPIPDERFFNVLLDIFGRRPGMQIRSSRQSPSWWKNKLSIAKRHFARRGAQCMTYDPTLVEIAKSMAEFGYELPLGFRRVLVGRASLIVQQDVSRRLSIIPYAFSRRHTPEFRAFSLDTGKERGLPVRRQDRVRRFWKEYKKSSGVT